MLSMVGENSQQMKFLFVFFFVFFFFIQETRFDINGWLDRCCFVFLEKESSALHLIPEETK